MDYIGYGFGRRWIISDVVRSHVRKISLWRTSTCRHILDWSLKVAKGVVLQGRHEFRDTRSGIDVNDLME